MGNMTNEPLHRQGGKSKSSSSPPDEEPNPEIKEAEMPSQQPSRLNPSGVPNEGRGSGHEYKGVRQSPGGIPNRYDRSDRDSTSSFRGTADRDTSEDAAHNDEYHNSAGQFRRDLISPIRSRT